jgi:hypothetical protein
LPDTLSRVAVALGAFAVLTGASPAHAQLPVADAHVAPKSQEPVPGAPSASGREPTGGTQGEQALPDAPPAPPGADPEAPSSPAKEPGLSCAKAKLIKQSSVAASAEQASPVDDDPAAGEEPRYRWYGWQTLSTDAAALALALLAGTSSGAGISSSAGEALGWLALGTYGLGAPAVHFVHRNPGRALGSFGIRLGMPIAGAFAGASLASGCDGFLCEASGAALGLLIGVGGAVAIDAAVLARETKPKHRDQRAGLLVPLVSLTPQRAWLGVAGEL